MRVNKSQFERLLDLDHKVRDKRYPNARRFARDWEISAKTALRDLAFLRDRLGAPLVFDRGRNGYYYQDDTWTLQRLTTRDEDFQILEIARLALAQYGGTFLAGEFEGLLDRILPDSRTAGKRRRESYAGIISFRSVVTTPINRQIWHALVDAILTRERQCIDYATAQGIAWQDERMDPYHLSNLGGIWYLVAWCERTRSVVQCAVHRISRIAATGAGFEMPSEIDIAGMVGHSFGRLLASESSEWMHIHLAQDVAPWSLDWQWHEQQQIVLQKDGSYDLKIPVRLDTQAALRQVVSWVLSWGSKATVLAPQRLKRLVNAEIQQMQSRLDGRFNEKHIESVHRMSQGTW